MSSSLQSRKEELIAKKARLAELKRQRELRQEQFAHGRSSIGGEGSPSRTAEQRRSEVDSLVTSLLDRQRESTSSPSRSRPNSIYGQEPTNSQNGVPATRALMVSSSTQTVVTAGSAEVESHLPPSQTEAATRHIVLKPEPEYIAYSKGVQTEPVADIGTNTEEDFEDVATLRARRRSSRKQKQVDEEIRANLRREIEEELKKAQEGQITDYLDVPEIQRFPLRQLTTKELNAVISSQDFQTFVERSSRVIERALDEEYDLLADYTHVTAVDADDNYSNKSAQSIRETLQLHSTDHSKRRMITDLHFSSHFPELLLTSYTKNASAPNEPNGLVLIWNTHAPSRPEYVFNATSDVLTARFSPFHPNIIIGGCYNGQVCIWDTRTSSLSRHGQPERRTPPSGPGSNLGHTHPIYSLNVIGTPNAHNIITADTDGVICSWSIDMLTQAQEYLSLSTLPAYSPYKTDDLASKSMSFPTSDPTFFVVGTEEGTIYPCHRYDRAGAPAGIDSRLLYRGHTAPVMSTQYHPGRGPIDLGDLMLSSSSDWTVRLWRTKSTAAPVTSSNSAANAKSKTSNTPISVETTDSSTGPEPVPPILTIPREDLVYDAKWSPNKPSVFAAVTGAGDVEVFDLISDIEVPVARATPSKTRLPHSASILPFKGLNKLAWEERQGRQLAVGGLDGVVSLFEVGRGLWCGAGEADVREWQKMKNIVSRLEGGSGR